MEIYKSKISGYWNINKKGEGAETKKKFIQQGDQRYDHFEVIEQDGSHFLFAWFRRQGSSPRGIKLTEEEAQKLLNDQADYRYIKNLFF